MKKEIKLSDLKQHDSMYFIGDLDPYRDGDGWVFEDEALEVINHYNYTVWKQNISINAIVKTLRENEVDGETMQFILQEVGMEWQMLRQLILEAPMEQVEYLVEEKKDLKLNM